MEFMIKKSCLGFLFVGLFLLLCSSSSSSQAYINHDFYVGGRDGWVLNPSENFNHWAERNRFQVNDTLIFKYKKGSESVLVVSKEGYEKCNTSRPLMRMDGGDSKFKFYRSGPFFFISGNQSRCEMGQKLIVVVLAVRHKPPPHAMSPTPPAQPPVPVPEPVPAPAPSPSSSPALTFHHLGLVITLALALGSFY